MILPFHHSTNTLMVARLLVMLLVLGIIVAVDSGCAIAPDSNGHVEWPQGNTTIGNWAFFGCTGLTSITLPPGVVTIGDGAFRGCGYLTSITLPPGVVTIGDWAFSQCGDLTSITLPPGVVTIGDSAFFQCGYLKSITLSPGVVTIGDSAFSGCWDLTSVTLPDSVVTIGNLAFTGCSYLASVTFGSSLTTIGYGAFSECTDLISVDFTKANNLTYLGNQGPAGKDGVFANSIHLTTLSIPASVVEVGSYAFGVYTTSGSKTGAGSLSTVYFGDRHADTHNTGEGSSIVVGQGAFESQPFLKEMQFAAANVTVGKDATQSFTNLQRVKYSSILAYLDVPDGLRVGIDVDSQKRNPKCSTGYGNSGYYGDKYFVCELCLAGSFSDSSTNVSLPCTKCDAGKYMYSAIIGSMTGQDCTPCPKGMYGTTPGSTSCSLPLPGYYTGSVGLTAPVPCPVNTYSSTVGAESCTPCANGTVALTIGLASCVNASSDSACSMGQYSMSGYDPCLSCPAGYHSTIRAATACVKCAPGSYSAGAGRAVCSTCPSNAVAPEGSYTCTVCDAGSNEVPNAVHDACRSCDAGEVASNGVCVPQQTSSSDGAIQGLLANNGTPLFVMGLVSIGACAFGLLIHSTKKRKPNVLQQGSLKHGSAFLFAAMGLSSELILAGFILVSGNDELRLPGVLLLLARLLFAVPPGVYALTQCMLSNSALLDEQTGAKSFRYHLDTTIVFKNSRAYAALLLASIFEAPMLCFLPWYTTPFSSAASYPSSGIMTKCLGIKFLQLIVTFIAQMMITLREQSSNKAFLALVYLNVASTCASFVLKLVDIFVKRNVLGGAALSDDCPAAAAQAQGGEVMDNGATATTDQEKERDVIPAHAHSSTSGCGAAGTGHQEEGDIEMNTSSERETRMTANPMHNPAATILPDASRDAAEASLSSTSASAVVVEVMKDKIVTLEASLESERQARLQWMEVVVGMQKQMDALVTNSSEN